MGSARTSDDVRGQKISQIRIQHQISPQNHLGTETFADCRNPSNKAYNLQLSRKTADF